MRIDIPYHISVKQNPSWHIINDIKITIDTDTCVRIHAYCEWGPKEYYLDGKLGIFFMLKEIEWLSCKEWLKEIKEILNLS